MKAVIQRVSHASVTVDGEFISSAYLYWQFNLMAYIAGLLGKKKDVKYFNKIKKTHSCVFFKLHVDFSFLNFEQD